MQTIAQQVNAIVSQSMAAVTLTGGYAVDYSGKHHHFEAAHLESEKRNKTGRVTFMLVSFSDDSLLSFRWSEDAGARYTVEGKFAAPVVPQVVTVTVEQIAQAVADNAKSGKWLSCTYQIAHPQAVGGAVTVGVKAFGKWVQRVECVGLVDGLPEQKTLKALKAQVIGLINGMLQSLGLPAQVKEGE